MNADCLRRTICESNDVKPVDGKLYTTTIVLQQTNEQSTPIPQSSKTNNSNNTHPHVSNNRANQNAVFLGDDQEKAGIKLGKHSFVAL